MLDYFNSIFEEAAFRWDGVNRIYGKTSNEIIRYLEMVSPEFHIDNRFDIENSYLFDSLYLIRKIANIERIAILNTLAEQYHVVLHTASKVDKETLGRVEVRLPVRPGQDAAVVYAGSRINLNVSLKGIEGGTAQRVMDIMGAGGFVLTNYCEETADIFEEDKEIVMFKSPEELFDKVEYYLRHEEERERIARAGYHKVTTCYTYEKKLQKLLEWVEG